MHQLIRRVGNNNHIYTYNGNKLVGFTAVRYYNQRKIGNEEHCAAICSGNRRYSPCMEQCRESQPCIDGCDVDDKPCIDKCLTEHAAPI